MLRTIFLLGLLVLLGIFLLRLLFGILAGLVALVVALLIAAFWVGAVGLVTYAVIRIVSPETARKIRRKFSGEGF